MPFSVTWHTLLDECEGVASDATLVAPLSNRGYRITDVQEHRIIVEPVDGDETQPLQREQFESLYRRIDESVDGFDLDNLPPGAEPYAAVWSLHPRYEIDGQAGVIREQDTPTTTQIAVEDEASTADDERHEPDLEVYSDALLLIDALERYPVEEIQNVETSELVNLYTLLSDVQRNANDLRTDVADVLLDRIHHDQPVHGQYGSVQRTSRRRRSLRDEDDVVSVLEDAGIDRERVTSIDFGKVQEALEVTEVAESDVFDVETSEYVRKAEVDEDTKETRLQGLKDRLAASDDPEADELREEIDSLESRIEELTEFKGGQEYYTRSEAK